MQDSIQKYQVVKLFKDKPAELLSNNHPMEEAKLICQKFIEELLIKNVKLDDIEYILTYQSECNSSSTNHVN
jgi:hypothetical protein